MSDAETTRVNLFQHAENVRLFHNSQERRLPVTIVTGFLGSGKTTLLNHILSNKSNLRIAAAINDFAELNIDENLVRARNETSTLVELSNGCVCCHLLDNLQDAIFTMLGDHDVDKINYLVVETSGVSDPLQIIRRLDQTWGKCYRARLDSVVTVIDSDRLSEESNPSAAAIAQLVCADVVIMNKVDLLKNEAACQRVEDCIKTYNSDAMIYHTTRCKVPLSAILDVQVPSADIAAITHEGTNVPVYVSATGGALRRPASMAVNKSQDSAKNHFENERFVSVSARINSGPLSLSRLHQFVSSPLVHRLTRIKGVLWIDGLEKYRCVIHLSGRGRLGFELDGQWTGPPVSKMAFIGVEIDAEKLKEEFQNCSNIEKTTFAQNEFLDMLQTQREFCVLENQPLAQESGIILFYLTGSKVYGYSQEEIETELRIDTNAMNLDLVDAVNASVDLPKAFLAYTRIGCKNSEKVVLCYPSDTCPANNFNVLTREAAKVLSSHFRNVQVCKCGA